MDEANIEALLTVQVAVIGAGPIGIEMATALERAGVSYVLLEAGQIGAAIMRWPPHTHFYSTPEHVALAGIPVHNLDQQAITGEQYLAYLRTLVEYFDLNLRLYEPVRRIERAPAGDFLIQTEPRTGRRVWRAQQVILATGGMARPRRLGIPGEGLPHVTHYFPGPHPYFRQRLLIVGGKNSALEAALRCWRAGAQVTLSYRRPALDFDRVKPHLADDVRTRIEKGEIAFLPGTAPVEITPTRVRLAQTGADLQPDGAVSWLETDFVLLATGFEADMSLFQEAGIALNGPAQVPTYAATTMETNVPGLYVAGTAAGGTQSRFVHFISTSHDHVARIMRAITGEIPEQLGSVPARNNAVSWDEVKAN